MGLSSKDLGEKIAEIQRQRRNLLHGSDQGAFEEANARGSVPRSLEDVLARNAALLERVDAIAQRNANSNAKRVSMEHDEAKRKFIAALARSTLTQTEVDGEADTMITREDSTVSAIRTTRDVKQAIEPSITRSASLGEQKTAEAGIRRTLTTGDERVAPATSVQSTTFSTKTVKVDPFQTQAPDILSSPPRSTSSQRPLSPPSRLRRESVPLSAPTTVAAAPSTAALSDGRAEATTTRASPTTNASSSPSRAQVAVQRSKPKTRLRSLQTINFFSEEKTDEVPPEKDSSIVLDPMRRSPEKKKKIHPPPATTSTLVATSAPEEDAETVDSSFGRIASVMPTTDAADSVPSSDAMTITFNETGSSSWKPKSIATNPFMTAKQAPPPSLPPRSSSIQIDDDEFDF